MTSVTCDGMFGCEPDLQYVLVAGGTTPRKHWWTRRFFPIALPSEIANLDEAGALPWWLAAFLGALGDRRPAARRGDRAARPASRRRDRAGARADDRRVAVDGAVGGGDDGRAGVAVGVPLGIVVGRLAWAATADRLGVIVEHGLPWWAPVVTAIGAVAVTLVLAELPARRTPHVPPTLRAE